MKYHGIVFDIQRASLHDGPGIRTTVFLKGCPLHCAWCHNPESWNMQPQLMFDAGKCVSCLSCVTSCAMGVHDAIQDRHSMDLTKCTGCGNCVDECVTGALKLSGRVMNVNEVLDQVLADKRFYNNSEGGLTVSGGEPMVQFVFLLELLKAARKAGIHTCIETSGYAEQDKFAALLPYVDLFLFDCKHTDDQAHRQYTGVSNKKILNNLDFLCRSEAKVLLRCPIIPGINDTNAHITKVAALTKKYPSLVGVELLSYHDLGRCKWAQLGKAYSLTGLKTMEAEEKQVLLMRFRQAGCRNVTI